MAPKIVSQVPSKGLRSHRTALDGPLMSHFCSMCNANIRDNFVRSVYSFCTPGAILQKETLTLPYIEPDFSRTNVFFYAVIGDRAEMINSLLLRTQLKVMGG